MGNACLHPLRRRGPVLSIGFGGGYDDVDDYGGGGGGGGGSRPGDSLDRDDFYSDGDEDDDDDEADGRYVETDGDELKGPGRRRLDEERNQFRLSEEEDDLSPGRNDGSTPLDGDRRNGRRRRRPRGSRRKRPTRGCSLPFIPDGVLPNIDLSSYVATHFSHISLTSLPLPLDASMATSMESNVGAGFSVYGALPDRDRDRDDHTNLHVLWDASLDNEPAMERPKAYGVTRSKRKPTPPQTRTRSNSIPSLNATAQSMNELLIARSIQRFKSSASGPLILPRSSSLTALVLDIPSVISGVLRHLPYPQVQRLSRLNKSWRELAAPILARQTVVLTLGWDWGGREWSVPVFPYASWELDAEKGLEEAGFFAAGPPGWERRRHRADGRRTSDDESLFGDSERDDARSSTMEETYFDAPHQPPFTITKFKPVTFNMEDTYPGPLPISSSELTQIRLTPLVAAPARMFDVTGRSTSTTPPPSSSHSHASRSVSSTPTSPTVFTPRSPPHDLSGPPQPSGASSFSTSTLATLPTSASFRATLQTPSFSRVIRGRLPRPERVFADAIFGPRCSLIMAANGSHIESVDVITAEGGAAVVGPGGDVAESGGASVLASEARWRQLLRYQKELGAYASRRSSSSSSGSVYGGSQAAGDDGSRPARFGHVGIVGLLDVRDSVAMRYYLSCPEGERIWAFRAVMETLIDPLDPERGHHEISEVISRIDRISHRVDILCQVDVPGTQRRERLNSYFSEACRAWLTVRGGDLSLRVSGYVGSMRNEEDVYEHIARVLVPAFT
ncbi:hypothetical protein DFJ73DRAFT_964811 [Zopfochytrium polystomum]|nr:hypothetical protein DFJ73DRAFT_964811 [Zopfochytrium polystomum]